MFEKPNFFKAFASFATLSKSDPDRHDLCAYLKRHVFLRGGDEIFDIVDGQFKFSLILSFKGAPEGTIPRFMVRSVFLPIGGESDFYSAMMKELDRIKISRPNLYLKGAGEEISRVSTKMLKNSQNRSRKVPHYTEERAFVASVGAFAQSFRVIEDGLAGLIRCAIVDVHFNQKGVPILGNTLVCATESDLMSVMCPEIPEEERNLRLMTPAYTKDELKESLSHILHMSQGDPDVFLRLLSVREELRQFIADGSAF